LEKRSRHAFAHPINTMQGAKDDILKIAKEVNRARLVLPDGGEAYVNGYDVLKMSGKVLGSLQAILGDPRGFDWRLNARQNLEFYAALYGLPKDFARKRIDKRLEFTGLMDRAGDMYQRFSTGMARNCALLLDTPTVGLDPASAVDFRHLLKDKLAKSEGRTIFIATHSM